VVGVLLGVIVAVRVGVIVGEADGVVVGVRVGVFDGVLVGVVVGVGVVQKNTLTGALRSVVVASPSCPCVLLPQH